MRRAAVLAAVAVLGLGAVAAQAECRQALVLALDVSGSVDDREYRLQMDGVATALNDPRVRAALLAMPEAPVAIAVFEWSSSAYQADVVPWTLLATDADIDRVVARLGAQARAAAPQATGIGAALRHAEALLAAGPLCWKQTVDVSGDGKNNDWPAPRDVYAAGGLATATVNGLLIGQESLRIGDDRQLEVSELTAYYKANVIHGPDAFIEVAIGYEDYAEAMTRKLLREVQSVAIGRLEPPDDARPLFPGAPGPILR